MKQVQLYQIDAFAENLFSGNPAAVCILENWLSEKQMQSIAQENNLAETAFVVKDGDGFLIRWFTPVTEVDLCGHATLAAAYVLFTQLGYNQPVINFYSVKSGVLKVYMEGELLYLDFPVDELTAIPGFEQTILQCIGIEPMEVYKGKTDYLAIIKDEWLLSQLQLNMHAIARLKARGLIVSAPGKQVDFVSRFFAPQSGIDEDPVTGSAHTSLIPYWAKKLGKTTLIARQISARGGELYGELKKDRCLIGGKGQLYLIGTLFLK